jgi:hypothetical protein
MDIVLLLDTSSAMGSSYENVNNYIIGPFLSEFLRIGDTFHLIAFSASPRLDVARRISGLGDIETIIGRMFLQYPIESGTNVASAITFAEQYTASLPQRPKKIVLVSSNSDAGNLVSAARQRLSASDISLDFVQVTPGQPLTNLPSSGRTPAVTRTVVPAEPAAADTFIDTIIPPAAIDTEPVQDDSDTESFVVSEPVPLDTVVDTVSETTDIAAPAPIVPEGLPEERGTRDWAASMPFIIIGIIFLLLILGLIMFFSSRRLGRSPNRVMAEVASSEPKEDLQPFVDHSKELAKYAAVQTRQRTTPYTDRPTNDPNKPTVINPSGPLLLNLYVEEQNTAIGRRNIHSLKSGYSLSVGGGKSDFLIFLVSMPQNIGEIRRSGSQCTFVPRKPKYFPDLGSNELRDCINKTIRVISDKNYELRFRFEMYEDPLESLNKMLYSIKIPG